MDARQSGEWRPAHLVITKLLTDALAHADAPIQNIGVERGFALEDADGTLTHLREVWTDPGCG